MQHKTPMLLGDDSTADRFGPHAARAVPATQMSSVDHAVEVAVSLGDSIVSVRHLGRCQRRERRRQTLALFVVGGLLILLAALAFARGVSLAGTNRATRAAWLDSGKSIHEFRPHRLANLWDVLAVGGAAGGLLLIGMASWRRRGERAEPVFRIGQSAGVDAPTSDSPLASWPLVEPMGVGYCINLGPGMVGQLVSHGVEQELSAVAGTESLTTPGARTVPLPPDGRVRLQCGQTTFHISAVPAPKEQAYGLLAGFEARDLGYVAGTAVAVLLGLAVIWELPTDARTLALDAMGEQRHLLSLRMSAHDDRLLEREAANTTAPDANDQAGSSGRREAGQEGRMGGADVRRTRGLYRIKRRSDTPQLARRQDAIEQARHSGVLGAFQGGDESPFGFETGTGDFSSGLGDQDIPGGMTGSEYAATYAGWGSGVRGVGPAGGGDWRNTIASKDWADQRFNVSPYQTNGGPGPRARARQAKAPPPVSFGPVESPDYDRAIIRRTIKKHHARFRHCYERQLVANRELQGTARVNFIINDRGAVISASTSGMSSEALHGCVSQVVRAIQFPMPPTGTVHKVAYPITFRPAGAR